MRTPAFDRLGNYYCIFNAISVIIRRRRSVASPFGFLRLPNNEIHWPARVVVGPQFHFSMSFLIDFQQHLCLPQSPAHVYAYTDILCITNTINIDVCVLLPLFTTRNKLFDSVILIINLLIGRITSLNGIVLHVIIVGVLITTQKCVWLRYRRVGNTQRPRHVSSEA